MIKVIMSIDCNACGKVFPICHAMTASSEGKWNACIDALKLDATDGGWLVNLCSTFHFCPDCAHSVVNVLNSEIDESF